jgi:hypothetical protein
VRAADVQEAHSYFTPKLSRDETPEWFVEVTDTEVGFARYVSPEETLRLQEEERRRQLAAAVGKDDAPERALVEMMGGQLESKDDLAKLEQVWLVMRLLALPPNFIAFPPFLSLSRARSFSWQGLCGVRCRGC